MAIQHVSDTARWVAVYRAMETARPDAIFRDPYAERLAGDEGLKIVNTLKRGRAMAWAMIVRTAVMDEMLLDRIAHGGVDTVLNLAAGLDTRAWRLTLPASLHWIDVDLPAMTDYKATRMRGERPVCRYEALAVDLTRETLRDEFLAGVATSARTVLVITEGLLVYLDESQVVSLAQAIHRLPTAHWWISDIASPLLLQFVNKSWGSQLEQGNAPFKFGPADSAAFFAPLGWRETSFRSMMLEGRRLNRQMRMSWLWRFMALLMPPKRRAAMQKMSGVILLERAVL